MTSLDATVIVAASKEAGAAVTFKKDVRVSSAGRVVREHRRVPAAKILVRLDGARATHGLLEDLEALNTTRRHFVAELTALKTWQDCPQGMRLIVRRGRPSRRHLKKLTVFETRTGWRYAITATNIRHMRGITGSFHSQFLDVLHRSHAGVEDRVRTNKAKGLGG